MLIYKWLNKAKERFYQITVNRNEAQGIVFNYHWGSCNSRRGGKKVVFFRSEEEAMKTIGQLMKRRKSRGYELITTVMN